LTGSKERDRRRARERYEEQRQQRLERRRKLQKRWGIALIVVCVLGLAGGLTAAFAGGSPAKPTAAASSSASATATASASASATASTAAVSEPATHCTYSTSGVTGTTVKASLPPATPNYKATYTATINTNLGAVKINLLNSKATCTVNSFVHLAQTGFWNNTQCHRVSNSSGLYMLQCGDPTAKASQTLSCSSSTLGSGTPGYVFNDENLTGATYDGGTVAMANSGANTNGSQFFLVFKTSQLSPSYTPFGTITSGLDILQKVANAGTTCSYSAGGGVPKDKVVIDSVTIKQA
jgi:peptidyl-prolyl cis-trans isomerase B (cyclophilin B)